MPHELNLDQLNAVVARVELNSADRPLTTAEIRMLDSLEAGLRQRSSTDRSGGFLDLLRRVSAVRTGKRDTGASVSAAQSRAVTNSTVRSLKAVGSMHRELTELAAKQPLQGRSLRRINEIVNETARFADRDPEYRRVYERALQIEKIALRPPKRKSSTGKSRGLVQNPGLTYGGREVLGGAPSSRRGH